MRTLASLVLLAIAPGFAAAQATKEDLKKLAKAGISEDVILTYLRANGYDGKPSSDDLIELKDAGVTDRILAGILSPEPAPAPAPTAPPARTEAPTTSTVYVERPVSAYPTGYLSLGPIYSYSSSYCPPVYRSYYSGSFYRPYYSSYRPYYSSSYCGPSYRSYSYHRSSSRSSSSHSSAGRIIRNGFGSRVRW